MFEEIRHVPARILYYPSLRLPYLFPVYHQVTGVEKYMLEYSGIPITML